MTVANQNPASANPTPLSVAEAFISVALAITAVDGFLSEAEQEALVLNLYTLQIFQDYSQAELTAAVNRAVESLGEHDLEEVIEAARKALSPPLRETAFFFAGDMAFSDGVIGENEAALLSLLQQHLEIEPEMAAKIMDVVAIKNRRLDWPINDVTGPGRK